MMDGNFYTMSLVELFEFFDKEIILVSCDDYWNDTYIKYSISNERYDAEIKVYIDFEDAGIEDFEEQVYEWITSFCSNWREVLHFVTMYSFEIWDKQERVDYKKIDYEYQVRKKVCYEYNAKTEKLNFWTE